MKTIEQAANYYAGITDDKHHNEALIYSPNDIANTFTAGVKFAQRWIPVDEELPEKNIDVIAKSNNTFWIARLQPHGKGLTLYSIKGSRYSEEFEATHWRPIKYK